MKRVIGIVLIVLCGCAPKPAPPPADTGAKDATVTFFGGLIAGEPARAYAVLDPDSQRRVPADQFTRLARSYTQNLGFSAEKVNVRTSEERGDSATAHVVLTGRGAGHIRRYSDAITLRRTGNRWGVILPDNFGHRTR